MDIIIFLLGAPLLGFAVIFIIRKMLYIVNKGTYHDFEKVITVRSNRILVKVLGISVLLVMILFIFFAITAKDTVMWDLILCCAVGVVGGSCLFSILQGFKLIFDDNGITGRARFGILFFTVYETCTLMPWNQIHHVYHNDDPRIGEVFYFKFKGTHRLICLSYTQQNFLKALAFAVKKLPADKFIPETRERLKKMGVWTDESEG